MLSKELYTISKQYNKITKYNIEYDRRAIQDAVCAMYIEKLLEQPYELTLEQQNKLKDLLNKLVVL